MGVSGSLKSIIKHGMFVCLCFGHSRGPVRTHIGTVNHVSDGGAH